MSAKIYRPVTGRVRLQTPFLPGNRDWLKSIGAARPTWSRAEGVWLVSRTHFAVLVRESTKRFGSAEIWTDHRSKEVCTPACQRAKGDECVCSCGGRHHKGGEPIEGWVDLGGVLVGDTLREHWTVTS